MLKKSAKDTLALALKFLIGIIRSSKKNIGGDSDLLRNEPRSRERCVMNECLLVQTVLKLALPSGEGSWMAEWLKGGREELQEVAGPPPPPLIVDLSWLAHR